HESLGWGFGRYSCSPRRVRALGNGGACASNAGRRRRAAARLRAQPADRSRAAPHYQHAAQRGRQCGAGSKRTLGQLAPQRGFAAVFPEGRAERWNHLPPGEEARAFGEVVFKPAGGALDDVAFLKLLVADLVQRGVSDPNRIYLVGRSAGGLMTLRMACEDAKLFAGIGLLIASMSAPAGASS